MSTPITTITGMADLEKTPSTNIHSLDILPEKITVDTPIEDIYIDPERERKLLWKIDAFLVPLLTLSFLSAYLDRSNIGNAAIAGMPEDLGLTKQGLASKSAVS